MTTTAQRPFHKRVRSEVICSCGFEPIDPSCKRWELVDSLYAHIERANKLNHERFTSAAAALEARVAALEAALEDLVAEWRDQRAHTYASENADLYRAGDAARQQCAEELRAALAQEEGNQ